MGIVGVYNHHFVEIIHAEVCRNNITNSMLGQTMKDLVLNILSPKNVNLWEWLPHIHDLRLDYKY